MSLPQPGPVLPFSLLRTARRLEPRRPGTGNRRPWASRALHRLHELSASTYATAVSAAVSVLFLLGALLGGSASRWLTSFEALAAAVTLVMVFALQHTQARQQEAVQRKLDEILRVLPGADPRLLHVESAHPEELDALAARHEGVRDAALSQAEGAA